MAESLAHTKWLCKYHIVFCPKYRRKIVFSKLRESIRDIIKDLCKWKGIEIIEGKMIVNYVRFVQHFRSCLSTRSTVYCALSMSDVHELRKCPPAA